MPDRRSKRAKLIAMARQTVSPHEAEVARRKLAAMGDARTLTDVVRDEFLAEGVDDTEPLFGRRQADGTRDWSHGAFMAEFMKGMADALGSMGVPPDNVPRWRPNPPAWSPPVNKGNLSPQDQREADALYDRLTEAER